MHDLECMTLKQINIKAIFLIICLTLSTYPPNEKETCIMCMYVCMYVCISLFIVD